MTNTKRRKLVYKQAIFNKPLKKTLEQLIRAAMKIRKTALSRRYQPTDEENRFNLVNYHLAHAAPEVAGMIYGIELIAYEAGNDPGAIALDPKADQLPIEQLVKRGDTREAVDGLLYAGFRGDHVVLVQSQSLKSLHLEMYLNWLLRETGQIDRENAVGLLDHNPQANQKHPPAARGIVVRGPLTTVEQTVIVTSNKEADDEVRSIVIRPKTRSWAAVREYFKDLMDFPAELKGEDAFVAASLQVEIKLEWLRAKAEMHSELLDKMRVALRHVEDECDYKIKTDEGEITKDQMKLFDVQNIIWGRVQPAFDDLFPRMLTYVAKLAKGGKIEM